MRTIQLTDDEYDNLVLVASYMGVDATIHDALRELDRVFWDVQRSEL